MKVQELRGNPIELCKCTTGGKQRFAVQDDLRGVHENKKPTAWANAACCAPRRFFLHKSTNKD